MNEVDPKGDADDSTAGIFPKMQYEPGQPPPRRFLPWHRPRKHYVRREQWTVQTRDVFTSRGDDAPVKYLGLPGVDLLDLRHLYMMVCTPLGRDLAFLGFNSTAVGGTPEQIELNTSLDEVRRLGRVDPQSEVLADDFRSLADLQSVAWERARLLGPFDVVNLDLCDGLAKDPPGAQGSHYMALGNLVAFQSRRQHPWLLFITTRAGRVHFDTGTLALLCERVKQLSAECPDFNIACTECLSIASVGDLDPTDLGDAEFLQFVLVALCAWVLALALAQGPNSVKMPSVLGYRVHQASPCEDLVSFALRFDPVVQGPTEPLRPQVSQLVDECAEATELVQRASQLANVDDLLEQDPGLCEELTVEMERLLQQCRYNVAPYREWLASGVQP